MVLKYAQDIKDWLVEHNRPVVPLLQEGLSIDDIGSITEDLTIRLPTDLKELYTWHNGTDKTDGYILGDVDFFPGFHFLPLEDAIAHYWKFVKDLRWEASWFPVFGNGGGDFFVVQCQEIPMEHAPVLGFMIGTDQIEIEYQSIESMLHTLSECYKRGIYHLSPEGYIESSIHEEAIVSNIINPGLSRWIDELG